jgi:hypothetical protein
MPLTLSITTQFAPLIKAHSSQEQQRDYTYCVPLWITHQGKQHVLYIPGTPITSYNLRTVRYHPSHLRWSISSCQVSLLCSSHALSIPSILHPITVLLSLQFPLLPPNPPIHPPVSHTPVSPYPCQQNSPFIPNFPTPQQPISTPP